MQRTLGFLAGILLVMSLAAAAPPAAAQGSAGGLSGIILDMQGKPVVDAEVTLKSVDFGTVYTTRTDKNGVYRQVGMRAGNYDLMLKLKGQTEPVVTDRLTIGTDPNNKYDIDLRKRIAPLTPEQEAAQKKQEEDVKKFNSMKAAFMDGQAKIEVADKARADMLKAPADQRSSLQPNVSDLYQQALHSFQQAQQAAPEKDPNLHLVYYKLGYSNEMLGNYDEAIADYQKAAELKPTPDYYNTLALVYAKQGKMPEAMQACDKSATLDPAKGATAWLNLGKVLYNTSRLAEAVEPLKKATTLNPNEPDGWYLLGASLLSTMQTKQQGDKITYIVTPGTVEAYQKYLALAPTGRFAGDAQASLQALQSLGAGVDTKVKVKKP